MSAAENKGVFLSYASQDAAAVQHIAEALRAAGIEVWFDRNELVGGDAWDAKIRGQIAACALFVPVISATTQARREGYFRIEWKLAAQRTHAMADGTPFLLPVVLDATRDAEALVPAEFKAVQWSRLALEGERPGAVSVPAFCARVGTLLQGQAGPAAPREPSSAPRQPGAKQAAEPTFQPASKIAIAAVASIALTAGLALWAPWKSTGGSPAVAAFSAPAPADKSIAVLPFANLSVEKDTEFFADGVHAEVLAHLQNIRELRVVSQQSVVGYRGTTKKSPEIARELGVSYLLGGNVRRSGNLVRVSVQLVDARNDTQLWSLPPDDRALDNIFVIQSQIAQATAAALHAVLSPTERSKIELRPTENTVAYDLFLRARELKLREPFSRSATSQRVEWLKRALALDPKFTRAWIALSDDYLESYFRGSDPHPERLAAAKDALDQALRLAPEAPETQMALAAYYYQGLRDYDRALALCATVAQSQPHNPEVIRLPGLIQRRQGNWPAALENLRKAVALDRGDASLQRSLAQTLRTARRWEEALAAQRRLVELVDGATPEAYLLSEIPFMATGSTREMAEFIRRLESTGAKALATERKKQWARQCGDFGEAIRLDELQPYFDDSEAPRYRQAAAAAFTLLAVGRVPDARARLENFPDELRAQLRGSPGDTSALLSLARMETVLGNFAEALRLAEMALARADAVDRWFAALVRENLAGLRAWAGQKEKALDELRGSFREPGGALVHQVRHSPYFVPLRGDPRFEQMIADPRNNAPLF